jgi:DNA-binding transcriptional ArsR family regulator
MKEAKEVFNVLSSELSIRILRLIVGRGEPVCVCEFATALEKPSYEISKSLKQLRKISFLCSKRHGKYNYYSVPKINDTVKAEVFDVVAKLKDEIFKEDLNRFVKEVCSVKKR